MKTNTEIIEELRLSLEKREYDNFVDLFADNGVYELPFSLKANKNRWEGIASIRDRFVDVGKSPQNKLFSLNKVDALVHETMNKNTVVVEFSIDGTLNGKTDNFIVNSSLAIIEIENGKIRSYKDYPNSIGIADSLGMLSRYIASISGQ